MRTENLSRIWIVLSFVTHLCGLHESSLHNKLTTVSVHSHFSFSMISMTNWTRSHLSNLSFEQPPHELCPVSTLSSFSGTLGHHLYPLDIYDPNNPLLKSPDPSLTAHCSEADLSTSLDPNGIEVITNLTCPLRSTVCPVTIESVLALRQSEQWPVSHSLCGLEVFMNKKGAVVNLIVFGSSVTAGEQASHV